MADTFERRFADVGFGQRWAGRNAPEIAPRKNKALVGRDIADHEQHRIGRRIVSAEKLLHVIEGGRVEIGKIAVKIVRIGPVAKCDWRQVEPRKTAVGLIEDVDTDFFFYDVALIAQIFVVDFQRAHAVCFQPEDAFDRVGWNRFVIIGDVVMRRTIQNAA